MIYLDHYSFSYDESISIKNTLLDFGHIKHEAEWDNNPPFYFYCIWVWQKLFPITEFNSRLLSLLFISSGIGLSFLLIRKSLDFYTALITTLFLTLSNFLTYHAHEARAYALVFLLAVASSLFFFRFIRQPGWGNLLVLSLLNFLIVYTHYISALVIVCQYAFILFFERKQLVKIYVFQTLIITALVLLRFTKKQFINIFSFNSSGDFWLKPATFQDFLNAVYDLFYSPVFLLTALVLGLSVFVLKNKAIPSVQKKFVYYCLLTGVFSLLFLYSVGIFKAVFLARYLIFTIPFVACVLVFGISRLPVIGYAAGLLVLVPLFFKLDLNPIKGNDYRSVAAIVRQNYDEKSCVIVHTKDNLELFLYYFDRHNFMDKEKKGEYLKSKHIFGISDTNDLKALNIEAYKTVYLTQTFNKKVNNQDIIQLYLEKKFEGHFNTTQYFAVELSVYKNP